MASTLFFNYNHSVQRHIVPNVLTRASALQVEVIQYVKCISTTDRQNNFARDNANHLLIVQVLVCCSFSSLVPVSQGICGSTGNSIPRL